MNAKELRSTDWLSRAVCHSALAILLCSTASLASAQSSPSASAGSGNANGKAAGESSRTAAVVDAGRIVFNQRCEICHFSESTAKKIGPGLKGLFARARFANGAKVNDASVAGIIGEGGKDMPGYQGALKPGQMQALIAYLKTR
jgi:cytochrome c